MSKRLVLMGFLTAFLLSGPSYADEGWKMVVRVEGKVQSRLASASRWKPVFSSRLLKSAKDRVRTQAKSLGQLRSSDGTVVTVGPSTELSIADWRPSEGKTRLKVVNRGGSIRAKVGKFFKGERDFKIETPHAVMSARGTEFVVVYDGPSADGSSGVTTMDVVSGEVSGNQNGQTVSVKAGFRYTSNGKTFSVEPSPPDFQGVPAGLVPPAASRKVVLEKSTMTMGDDPAGEGGSAVDPDGGVYTNALLPFLDGASTAPILINITVTGGGHTN